MVIFFQLWDLDGSPRALFDDLKISTSSAGETSIADLRLNVDVKWIYFSRIGRVLVY